jgi:serine/threonine-protein kinase RsbW
MKMICPILNEAITPAVRTFPAAADRVRSVRAWVSAVLADHPRRDDAVLIASELATNVVRHVGGDYSVWVLNAGGAAWIHVHDQGSANEPRIAGVGLDAEGGRGLLTVAAVADAHGSSAECRQAAISGRCSWAQIGMGAAK